MWYETRTVNKQLFAEGLGGGIGRRGEQMTRHASPLSLGSGRVLFPEGPRRHDPYDNGNLRHRPKRVNSQSTTSIETTVPFEPVRGQIEPVSMRRRS
jgi:hypothetical protein